MAERRFFSVSEPIDGRLEIAGDEFHHIARVMRQRPGDFGEPEKKRLRDAGFQPARLNDVVRKTETAALSGAAILKND